MPNDEVCISRSDLLSAVTKAAQDAVAAAIGSEEARAVRDLLTRAATCVSLEQVAQLWSVTPRAARRLLREHGIAALDLGHRTPRYVLTDVVAVVRTAAPAAKPAKARFINFEAAA